MNDDLKKSLVEAQSKSRRQEAQLEFLSSASSIFNLKLGSLCFSSIF